MSSAGSAWVTDAVKAPSFTDGHWSPGGVSDIEWEGQEMLPSIYYRHLCERNVRDYLYGGQIKPPAISLQGVTVEHWLTY